MLPFLQGLKKHPRLSDFPLRAYPAQLSMSALVRGVDNVRHDVHISPGFLTAACNLALALIANHGGVSRMLFLTGEVELSKKRLEFKRLFSQIMAASVDKARMHRQVQVDYLAQVASIKLVQTEITRQWQGVLNQLRSQVRERETGGERQMAEALRLREEYARLILAKQDVLRETGRDMFSAMAEVQESDMREMRHAIFGRERTLSPDFFQNPMIYVENRADPVFMMEEYVLLGHRTEDNYRYDNLLETLRDILYRIEEPGVSGRIMENLLGRDGLDMEIQAGDRDEPEATLDTWIKEVDNIDVLFNHYRHEREYEERRGHGNVRQLYEITRTAEAQRRLLDIFYRQCGKKGIVDLACAYFALRPVYRLYCPPLVPHKLLEYMMEPRSRKSLADRIKKINQAYGREMTLDALNAAITQVRRMGSEDKKRLLIRFVKRFVRYHRDLQNFVALKDAMDSVNVTSGNKTVILSRANNTLYEFCLPHEQGEEEQPVINHVVLKADVRGSTDITVQMKKRGLNPASYFSMNLFDPITSMLREYGADKEFIEGDAIIISVSERQDTPKDWYSVARCCGLAVRIISILRRYNARNVKNGLPRIEVGIGICFENSPPTFLMDGTNRIMISAAINKADRLSACGRQMRARFENHKGLFNLYVFQAVSDKRMSETADDLFWRYNVNGIQIDTTAFEKLSNEISLKTVSGVIPEFGARALTLHFGRFPTISGRYQTLVIREAHIPEVNPEDLRPTRFTYHKFYEVCTARKLYQYADNLL
ncbi:MAG: hypothetical protein ACLFOY_03605 [Desulfatibacillaceae bacterium]